MWVKTNNVLINLDRAESFVIQGDVRAMINLIIQHSNPYKTTTIGLLILDKLNNIQTEKRPIYIAKAGSKVLDFIVKKIKNNDRVWDISDESTMTFFKAVDKHESFYKQEDFVKKDQTPNVIKPVQYHSKLDKPKDVPKEEPAPKPEPEKH